MNKVYHSFLIAGVTIIVACNSLMESPETVSSNRVITLTATREGLTPETRSLRLDDGSVWWNPAEEISVFCGRGVGGGDKFVSTNTSIAESVLFEGSIQMNNPDKIIWAVYPYSESNSCDGNAVTLYIPTLQKASEANFSDGVFPAIARTESFDLQFMNICGGVKFFVLRDDIKSLTFKGNNGETLAGKVKITINESGVPEVSEVLEGVTEVTLLAPRGGAFIPGKSYYLTLLPTVLERGMSISFTTSSEVGSFTSDIKQTIKRSVFGVLKSVDSKVSSWKSIDPESVDLGLSVLWSSFNVGATSIEDFGDYYAWGETDPKENYDWYSYKWCVGSNNWLTKYNNDNSYGVVDGISVLDPEDDAATVNWGGGWRTPSIKEWGELLSNCSWVWTTQNNTNGYLVTSNISGYTDKSIFLPAAGERIGTSLDNLNTTGRYWYSSITDWNSADAFDLFFDQFGYGTGHYLRNAGRVVRAVMDKENTSTSGDNTLFTWFSPNDWSGGLDPGATYEDGVITLTVPDGTGGLEWTGQVWLYTSIPIDPAKQYYFSATISSSMDGVISSKLTSESDIYGKELFYDNNINVLNGSVIIEKCGLSTSISNEEFLVIFDFGRLPIGSKIKISDIVIRESLPTDGFTGLCLEAVDDGVITITNPHNLTLEYILDSSTLWVPTNANPITISVSAGDIVRLKGNNPAYALSEDPESDYLQSPTVINCSSDCFCYGNIMSLISSWDYQSLDSFSKPFALAGLFRGNTHLINHPEKRIVLPATFLTSHCYHSMFEGCSRLSDAPDLPALLANDGCYFRMFAGCANLTSAPILPAKELQGWCYGSMFYGCSSLVSASDLPATYVPDGCYDQMFYDCVSLKTAPKIYATKMGEWCCWRMFAGCVSLSTVQPDLYVTELAHICCGSMFSGCASLIEGPNLPAVQMASSCYSNMFNGCSSLVSAPSLPATTLADYCYYSMFSGCSSLVSAPALPATTLADHCYYSMFSDCSALVTAPSLPAMTLTNYCYYHMFDKCVNLIVAPQLPATEMADNCYSGMFNQCSSLETIPSLKSIGNGMFAKCDGLTTITIPDGVKSVASSAFASCPNLIRASLPSSIESIGRRAFYMAGLKQITVAAEDPPSMENSDVFLECPLKHILIPTSSLEAYINAPVWSDYEELFVTF